MDILVEGHLTKVSFTRMFVLQHWLNANGTEKNKSYSILDIISKSLHDIPNADYKVLETRIVYVCKKLTYFWKKTCRKRCLLVKNYSGWLNTKEVCIISENNNYLPYSTSAGRPSTSAGRPSTSAGQPSTSAGQPSTSGRPFKDFAESSKRSKRRRLATLSEVDSSAVDYLLNNSNTPIKRPGNEEVLSLITETKLSKNQYLLLRDFINLYTSSEFLPSYQKIIQTKKLCYPENEKITEVSAEVELQSLLDHTAKRILESQEIILQNFSPDFSNMILFGKWGFDGSTGQSEYKQSFLESNADDDSSLFVTSFVPLRLICEKSNQVFWKNPRPSPTRYCRPIRFRFAKETKELSLQEEAYIKNQISNLNPFIFEEENIQVRITYSLQLTMVDGKVCCALSETATSKCYICGASPKEMNNIEKCLEKPVNECKYEFGISPLHSWIRFFEFCIHLSYRLHIQKWQMRSDEDKASFAERKKYIQDTFRQKLGLIIDRPRSGGSGTSNDGNTARKFFANASISAEITGIDKNILERCHTILITLSSGFDINCEQFKIFALETARLIIQEYGWYNLPSSVHKVLIHGSDIINHALLPIGELSEEAAEATNKNFKLFRRDHTRKMSRKVCNTDLFHQLLLNSDPLITSLRKLPKKQNYAFSDQVISLLKI